MCVNGLWRKAGMRTGTDMSKELVNLRSKMKLLLSQANKDFLETVSEGWRARVLGHGAKQ